MPRIVFNSFFGPGRRSELPVVEVRVEIGEGEPDPLSEALAKMPTREQAISTLMGLMKAPIQKLARTLNEVPGKLVRTLAAVRDAKDAA